MLIEILLVSIILLLCIVIFIYFKKKNNKVNMINEELKDKNDQLEIMNKALIDSIEENRKQEKRNLLNELTGIKRAIEINDTSFKTKQIDLKTYELNLKIFNDTIKQLEYKLGLKVEG